MSIQVDTASLRDKSMSAKSISASVGNCKTGIKSVRSSLPSKVLNNNGIGYRLNSVYNRIAVVQECLSNMGQFLSSAADSYCQIEQSINLSASEVNLSTSDSDSSDVRIGSTANDILGKMGYIGNVLAFFTKPIASWVDSGKFSIVGTGATAVTSLLKDGNSTLKGLYEWSLSNKKLEKLSRMLPERAKEVRIKRLFGLQDMFSGRASVSGWKNLPADATWLQKATATEGWTSRWYNNFNKIDSPWKSYTAGGAKAAFAWVGLGLTAISNAKDNYDEYRTGKINVNRAVAETVTETVIDVGKNWVIGAAVAAGVAATIGSAPVIVVGALTVGVTVGLDWACKKITGAVCGEEKDLTETLSDLVLNVGEAAFSVGKKCCSTVVSKLKSGLTDFKSSLNKGFSSLFST